MPLMRKLGYKEGGLLSSPDTLFSDEKFCHRHLKVSCMIKSMIEETGNIFLKSDISKFWDFTGGGSP